MPKQSHCYRVEIATGKRRPRNDEERRKDLPFPSPRGDVFYRRGGLLPPCHREAADFAGVAVFYLKGTKTPFKLSPQGQNSFFRGS